MQEVVVSLGLILAAQRLPINHNVIRFRIGALPQLSWRTVNGNPARLNQVFGATARRYAPLG